MRKRTSKTSLSPLLGSTTPPVINSHNFDRLLKTLAAAIHEEQMSGKAPDLTSAVNSASIIALILDAD